MFLPDDAPAAAHRRRSSPGRVRMGNGESTGETGAAGFRRVQTPRADATVVEIRQAHGQRAQPDRTAPHESRGRLSESDEFRGGRDPEDPVARCVLESLARLRALVGEEGCTVCAWRRATL